MADWRATLATGLRSTSAALAFAAMFLLIQIVYIYHDRLPPYSRTVRINATFVVGAWCLGGCLALITFVAFWPSCNRTRQIILKSAVIAAAVIFASAPLCFQPANEAYIEGGLFEIGDGGAVLYQVFFPNGSDKPYPNELETLESSLSKFNGCSSMHIVVSGFASSAAFPGMNSDAMNMQLAQRRVTTILNGISKVNRNVDSKVWKKSQEMTNGRYHLDRWNGKELPTQLVNRRVDVLIFGTRQCLQNVTLTGEHGE